MKKQQNNEFKKAYQIAIYVHGKQKRWNGKPYMSHIIGVTDILRQAGYNKHNLILVGLLHDTLEDCPKYQTQTIENIIKNKINKEILYKVQILTHNNNESYDNYIDRVVLNKDATIVKIADMVYNLADTIGCSQFPEQRKNYLRNFPKLLKVLINDNIKKN